MDGFAEYERYDGLGLAELVRTGQVTPVDLLDAAIARIEERNPEINAVIQPMYDEARWDVSKIPVDAPLAGVPFLLKDLITAYAGVPLRNGSRFLKDYVPNHDSELVKRFKAAGLLAVGKANCPEFGLVAFTEPELFGPTNNPWDLSRTAGGSSGGSAAAVAARIVPIAHGGDGGGSIRIPASCCGIFGLKPSRGRNPLGPDVAEAWHGLTVEHALTLSVRDSAAVLDATAGCDAGSLYAAPTPARPFLDEVGTPPGTLRIAVSSQPFLPSTVHPDCVTGLERAAMLCSDLGHEVSEAAPVIDGSAFAAAFFTMICGETAAEIRDAEQLVGRKATSQDFEDATWAVSLLGRQINAEDYSSAIRILQRAALQLGEFMKDYDVLLTPTLARPPVLTGELQPKGFEATAMKVLGRMNAGKIIHSVAGVDAMAQKVFEFMPYTPVFNATGQPAMSVPLHWNDEGLPIGMHFVARYGDEATLFRLAAQLEEAAPWFELRPPVASSGPVGA